MFLAQLRMFRLREMAQAKTSPKEVTPRIGSGYRVAQVPGGDCLVGESMILEFPISYVVVNTPISSREEVSRIE